MAEILLVVLGELLNTGQQLVTAPRCSVVAELLLLGVPDEVAMTETAVAARSK